ncbi:MAG TPA: F0F1 ATP synthase subunit epsilon [Anaerolineales bacterium]|nr:F0F1 ATP synthase subunit epsilon [Anaerolineales bacterium]
MTIHCEIITQERIVYADDVDMVVAPGADGVLGILPHHAPLLTTLQYGELLVRKSGKEEVFAIGGGVLEVTPSKVTVLADAAERADEIDLARADAARQRAQELLAEGLPPGSDRFAEIENALRRSNIRLKVGQKRRRSGLPGAMDMSH